MTCDVTHLGHSNQDKTKGKILELQLEPSTQKSHLYTSFTTILKKITSFYIKTR